MEHQFDELTRVLADAPSRRQAFKILGGFTLGTLGALFMGGRAEAQTGPCHSPANGTTCEANEITCQVGGASVCCINCSNKKAQDYCQGGNLVYPCGGFNGQCCGSNEMCVNNQCVPSGMQCKQPSSCGAASFCAGGNCFCVPTTEGKTKCAGFVQDCSFTFACTSSQECEFSLGKGAVCATRTCCGTSVCLPPCSGVF